MRGRLSTTKTRPTATALSQNGTARIASGPSVFLSSFPRKREPRGGQRNGSPWTPAFAGETKLACSPENASLAAHQAGGAPRPPHPPKAECHRPPPQRPAQPRGHPLHPPPYLPH